MEGNIVTVDNYSIKEIPSSDYQIYQNGTPVAYIRKSLKLSKHEMKLLLLDYIAKSKGEYNYDK